MTMFLLNGGTLSCGVNMGTVATTTHPGKDQPELSGPRRRVILLDGLLNRIAPIIGEDTPPADGGNGDTTELQLPAPVPIIEDISEQPTLKLPVVPMHVLAPVEQPAIRTETTPQEREAQVRYLELSGLSSAERVARVYTLFPHISDRELGKLSNVSAATAKKYRVVTEAAQP